MSRWPRAAGYALMVAALGLAVAQRRGAVEAVGPFPVMAVALLIGAVGVMLVFTDLMVRGLYAQVGSARRNKSSDGGAGTTPAATDSDDRRADGADGGGSDSGDGGGGGD